MRALVDSPLELYYHSMYTYADVCDSDDVIMHHSAGKCQRGKDGGRACNNKAISDSFYCKHHICSHAGCTTSKSSSDKACLEHLPSKPRSQSATAKKAQQQQKPQQQQQQGRKATAFTPPKDALDTLSTGRDHGAMRKQATPSQSNGRKPRRGKHQSSGMYGFAGNGGGKEAEEV